MDRLHGVHRRMIWRLWSLGRLARQRDASALAYMNWKDSLTSIIRWTLPFSTCGWRENRC